MADIILGSAHGRGERTTYDALARPKRSEPALTVKLRMTNESGAVVLLGSAVQFVTSATVGRSFTTTAAKGDERICGIALEDIGIAQDGLVAIFGYVPRVRVAAGTTFNQWLRQSTTAGVLEGLDDQVQCAELLALTTRDADGYCEAIWVHPHSCPPPITLY